MGLGTRLMPRVCSRIQSLFVYWANLNLQETLPWTSNTTLCQTCGNKQSPCGYTGQGVSLMKWCSCRFINAEVHYSATKCTHIDIVWHPSAFLLMQFVFWNAPLECTHMKQDIFLVWECTHKPHTCIHQTVHGPLDTITTPHLPQPR